MSPCQMQMQMQTSQSRLSLACKARAFPVGVHPHLAAAMLQTLVLLLLLLLHRCTSLVALLSQIRRLLLLLQQLRLGLMVLQLLQSLTQWHSPASRWKWRSPWAGCHPPVQLSASGCLRWTPPWFTSQGSRLRGSGIRQALCLFHGCTPQCCLPAALYLVASTLPCTGLPVCCPAEMLPAHTSCPPAARSPGLGMPLCKIC